MSSQSNNPTQNLKAMLLAAGKGERMMPLTATTPKPLLEVGGTPLLTYHINRLKEAGISQIIINHSHLGQQIEEYYHDGSTLDVSISWSREETPLETAGGIIKALPLLGNNSFLIFNGDVWCDISVEEILAEVDIDALNEGRLFAHLVLVPNPPHNPTGDFGLDSGMIKNQSNNMYTYAGIAMLSPRLFNESKTEFASEEAIGLAPLLRNAAIENKVSGQIYKGDWQDIGTPDRLQALRLQLESTENSTS